MYLLYVDESGVTNPHASQTSHYVLFGLAVHVGTWFALTRRVRELKSRYALDGDTESLEGRVDRVIESPFFLDSRANSGVQVADLCAYAVRRYLENGERERFETIFPRFFRQGEALCGLGHFTGEHCSCLICSAPKAELKRKKRRSPRDGRPFERRPRPPLGGQPAPPA